MPYSTCRLTPEYRDALLRLWADNMSDPRIGSCLPERYSWLYERNPAGQPTTVIAINDTGGEAVGCGSVYPRRMQVAGREVLAAVPADFAVDRRHRIGGAALMIQRALVSRQQPAPAFFFGFPNKSSLTILQRVGYKPIGVAQRWVKPLRVAGRLQRYIGVKSLARLAALPADVSLATADIWRARGIRGYRVQILSRADERFDRLWERARGRFAITGERTATYLNWRYSEFTTTHYQFFTLLNADGSELLGYIVFSETSGDAVVVDLFCIDMTETAESLLIAFARWLRRNGRKSVLLVYAGHADFGRRLRRLGFYQRGDFSRKLVALGLGLTPEDEAFLFDVRNWYMFDGEMDI